MTQRLLHGDAHHRVTLFPGPAGSRRAVVCFEPGRERMAGFEPAAAPHFATRLGLDALVVQTARRDWFLSPASPALAAVIGAKPVPRTEVTKKVWEYIKANKLQDAVNKRNINADAKLTGKGDATDLFADIAVEVAIPMMGAVLEPKVADWVQDFLTREASMIEKYISDNLQ